jgi:hypothetical protein
VLKRAGFPPINYPVTLEYINKQRPPTDRFPASLVGKLNDGRPALTEEHLRILTPQLLETAATGTTRYQKIHGEPELPPGGFRITTLELVQNILRSDISPTIVHAIVLKRMRSSGMLEDYMQETRKTKQQVEKELKELIKREQKTLKNNTT